MIKVKCIFPEIKRIIHFDEYTKNDPKEEEEEEEEEIHQYIEDFNAAISEFYQNIQNQDYENAIAPLHAIADMLSVDDDMPFDLAEAIKNSDFFNKARSFISAKIPELSYWILKCLHLMCFSSTEVVETILTYKYYQYYINPFYEEEFPDNCFEELLYMIGSIVADSPRAEIVILEAYDMQKLISKGLSNTSFDVNIAAIFCASQIIEFSSIESCFRMLNGITVSMLELTDKMRDESEEQVNRLSTDLMKYFHSLTKAQISVKFLEENELVDKLFGFVFANIPDDGPYRTYQTQILVNVFGMVSEEEKVRIIHCIPFDSLFLFIDINYYGSLENVLYLILQMLLIDENIVSFIDDSSLIEKLMQIHEEVDTFYIKEQIMCFLSQFINSVNLTSILEKFIDDDFLTSLCEYSQTIDEKSENTYSKALEKLYFLPSNTEETREFIDDLRE